MTPFDQPSSPAPPASTSLQAVTVLGWSDEGFPLVQRPGPPPRAVEAQMLAGVSDEDIDRAIAGEAKAYAERLGDGGVLIVGVTRGPRDASRATTSSMTVVDDDGRVVVQATDRLELRCGEASICLRSDGKIKIRGVDVTTRARRTQRIRGGTVLIN